MKKKQIRKNIFKFSAITTLLGIVAIYWYLLPIPQYTATTLCSLEGRQVQVVIDVIWQRSLFSPAKVSGTITVDGTTYNSVGNVMYNDGSFLSELKAKFSSSPRSYMFSCGGPWVEDQDILYLDYAGENLDKEDSPGISCWVIPHGQQGTYYYGPAKNLDEVNAIIAKRTDN